MSASLVSLASLVNAYEPMTPQLRVAAVIEEEARFLVVEHRKRAQRYWVLPGGRLEANETLSQALARELREELSLQATVGRLLAVYETLAPDRHTVNLAFQVRVDATEPRLDASDQVLAGWRWLKVDELSQVDFRPPLAGLLGELLAERFSGPVRMLGDTWTAAER